MSWSIYVTGTKNGVKREVKKASAYGDTSQIESVKPLILAEIDAMPEAAQGVKVEASGHHDTHSRNLNIKVEPIHTLALDE